jgi:hypothetical protein
VAIVSTVARSEAGGGSSLSALTSGFQSAFAAAIVFAGVGLAAAVLLLGRPRGAAALEAEPATVD